MEIGFAHGEMFIGIIIGSALADSIAEPENIETHPTEVTSELEGRLALRPSADIVRLVRIIAAIVVSVAHELFGNANAVGAFEFVGTTSSSLRVRAISLVRSVRTILPSVAPELFRNTSSVVTLLPSKRADSRLASHFVRVISALSFPVTHLNE